MFMLSRDKLNMDLDRQSLDLMLRLLGVDIQEEMSVTVMGKRALNRNKDRVKEVYEQWKLESGASGAEMEDVSVCNAIYNPIYCIVVWRGDKENLSL